jgi:hypothetical protein
VTEPGGKVALGWIHPGTVSSVFSDSLRMLRLHDLCNSRRIAAPGEVYIQCASGQPTDSRVEARNKVVGGFLAETTADWLLWIDADMGFAPDTLDRLLASADAESRPMVGALCFAGANVGPSSFGGHWSAAMPTIYDAIEDEDRAVFSPRLDYARGAVVECAATGSALVLVHRRVFEAVAVKWGAGCWYKQITHPKAGNVFGEDMSFCIRVRDSGFPVMVDTSVKTTHDKGWAYLDEEFFDAQQGDQPGRLKVRVDPKLAQQPNRAQRRRMARAK